MTAVKTAVTQGTAVARNGVGPVFTWKISGYQLHVTDTASPVSTAGMTERAVQRGKNMPVKKKAASGPTIRLKNLGIMSTRVRCRSGSSERSVTKYAFVVT